MTAVVLTQEEPVCAREGNGAQNCVNCQLVLVLIQVVTTPQPCAGDFSARTIRNIFLRNENWSFGRR